MYYVDSVHLFSSSFVFLPRIATDLNGWPYHTFKEPTMFHHSSHFHFILFYSILFFIFHSTICYIVYFFFYSLHVSVFCCCCCCCSLFCLLASFISLIFIYYDTFTQYTRNTYAFIVALKPLKP